MASPPPITKIALRPPSTSTSASSQPADTQGLPPPPTAETLAGTWHVTHSTLPMWRKKRNVRITYTPLDSSGATRLDDLVEYQSLSSDKVKTVRGIDTEAGVGVGSWDWRGRGWLKVAGSHWEVLGWGTEGAEAEEMDEARGTVSEQVDTKDRRHQNTWAVTYFAKTMFTPAGIDLYSRDKAGLQEETVTEIKKALENMADPAIRELAGRMFAVTQDGGIASGP